MTRIGRTPLSLALGAKRARWAPALLLLGAGLLTPRVVSGAACGVTAVTPVGFGTYNPNAATALDALGSVTYQCTILGALDVVYIDLGKGSSGTFTPRRLVSAGHTIDYNLYLDAARMVVWGDGTGGTQSSPATILTLFPVTLTVYGRIPPLQNAFVGSYVDTIVVTANF